MEVVLKKITEMYFKFPKIYILIRGVIMIRLHSSYPCTQKVILNKLTINYLNNIFVLIGYIYCHSSNNIIFNL